MQLPPRANKCRSNRSSSFLPHPSREGSGGAQQGQKTNRANRDSRRRKSKCPAMIIFIAIIAKRDSTEKGNSKHFSGRQKRPTAKAKSTVTEKHRLIPQVLDLKANDDQAKLHSINRSSTLSGQNSPTVLSVFFMKLKVVHGKLQAARSLQPASTSHVTASARVQV